MSGGENEMSADLGVHIGRHYEFINAGELAERWAVPETWVRERVRSRCDDPLPHVKLGKYVRFRWGSPELEEWAERRIVGRQQQEDGAVSRKGAVMKRSRHQKGYVYRKGGLWLVRYYDNQVLPDGTIRRIQRAHKLIEAIGEYRSKKAARLLAEEFLAPLNDGRITPQSSMTLTRFFEGSYLPFVETHKRVSTLHGYRNMWKRYLQPHGEIALRDFRTANGERILDAVAHKFDLTNTTLRHVKALLSGVFRYAKRQGVINSENPMRDVVIPKVRRQATPTHTR
jgi:hypothetical protein